MNENVMVLKKKVSAAVRKYNKLGRSLYWAQFGDGDFEELAKRTNKVDVLTALSTLTHTPTRIAVAQNPFTPYEVQLYLLGCKDVDVVYAVLLFAKLEESDFLALIEQFERGVYGYDATKFLQLIDSFNHWGYRFRLSQSHTLIFNPHISNKVFRSIKVRQFFKGKIDEEDSALWKILKNIKKGGEVNTLDYANFGLSRGDPDLPDVLAEVLDIAAPSKLLDGVATMTPEDCELEKFILSHSSRSGGGVALGENCLMTDRNTASSEQVVSEELEVLLRSHDKTTVKNALKNYACPVDALVAHFNDHPIECHNNPNFGVVLLENPFFFDAVDVETKKKLIKKLDKVDPGVLNALFNDYKRHIVPNRHYTENQQISKSFKKWGVTLQMIASHPATTANILAEMHDLFYSDNPRVSPKRLKVFDSIVNHPNYRG
jgi:hypothetical protein